MINSNLVYQCITILLLMQSRRKNNYVCIITVVVEETMHRAVLMVWHKDLHDLNNGTIQLAIIIPCRVFPCCKTNMTPIRSIFVDGVACRLILHKQA